MSVEHDFITDLEASLLDWLDFDRTSRRKVIARKRINGRLHILDLRALQAARKLQDEGRLSIITRVEPKRVTYIAERPL